jgi:hypothetical protein
VLQCSSYTFIALLIQRLLSWLSRCEAVSAVMHVPCRQQLLEPLGHNWQGLAGVPGEAPSSQQLARLVAGAKGLLVVGPGRLMAQVHPQVRPLCWHA